MNIKKNIPNLLTLCNLFCGCVAIVFAFQGNLVWSAYIAGIACVFDFLDGLVARALNVYSETGKQLDSLADIVSFGAVPGIILFILINQSLITCGADAHTAVPVSFCGFIVTLFSAIRLAKFNLDVRQTDSFIGLPTPANTILITSFIFIINDPDYQAVKELIIHPYFLIVFAVISSFLLVAPLPLFSLKFKNFSWKGNKVQYIFLSLSIILLVTLKLAGIPLIIILYIILSLINNYFSKSVNVSPTNYE